MLVEDLDVGEDPELTNAQLKTIAYVLSRYGNLSAADLRTLVRAADPWWLAAARAADARIERAWIRDWFRRAATTVEPGEPALGPR